MSPAADQPLDHQAAFDALARARGTYLGRGTDAEGRMFSAELELTAGVSARNLAYHYRAAGWEDGAVLHEEDGLLGVGLDRTLTLFAASSQYRHMFPRPLRRVERLQDDGSGPATRLVFGHEQRLESFRDEIALTLGDARERLGYSYAWGLPGNALAERAAVTMRPVASLADERPVFVRHWSALVDDDDSHYPGDDELLAIGAAVGRKLGLTRIGVHVDTLPTGRRTSYPHAEKTEEELVMVLAGHPDAWLDGALHPLRPGDVVAFPAGTGICHTFINNGPEEARLLVIGEHRRADNQVYYPLNALRMEQIGDRAWRDPPPRELGPHDGLPDRVRQARRG